MAAVAWSNGMRHTTSGRRAPTGGLHFQAKSRRRLTSALLAAGLAAASLALQAPARHAGAVLPTPITSCTGATVQADMQAGGDYVFQCDGVIGLPYGIVVSSHLSLDATGHSVTLQPVNPGAFISLTPFVEVTGGSLSLTNLTVKSWEVGATSNQSLKQGANGIDGIGGTPAATATGNGGDGTAGTAGGAGPNGGNNTAPVEGAALKIDSGTVALANDTFSANVVIGASGDSGGFGGNGGNGGSGGNGGAYGVGGNGAAGGAGGAGGNGGNGGNGEGGAIYNAGTLTISGSTFTANAANGGSGGVSGFGGWGGTGGSRGLSGIGIIAQGSQGSNGPGAPSGNGGTGADGQGGAIYNAGTLQLLNTTFSSNVATGGAGGPVDAPGTGAPGGNSGSGGPAGNGAGGGLYDAGTTTFSAVTFTSNSAIGGAGGAGAMGGGGTSLTNGGSGGNGGAGGGAQGGAAAGSPEAGQVASCSGNTATAGAGGAGGPSGNFGGPPAANGPPGIASTPGATFCGTLTPSLAVTSAVTNPTPVPVGTPSTMSITLANQGTGTITGVTPSLTFTTSNATVTGGPTPPSADLAPGTSATFTVPFDPLSEGQASATVGGSGTANGSPVTAPSKTRTFTIGGVEMIAELVNPPGQLTATPLTLQVKVTALVSGGISNIAVGDPVKVTGSGPGGLNVVGRSGTTFTLGGSGASAIATFSLTSAATGPFAYTVTVTGTDTGGQQVTARATGGIGLSVTSVSPRHAPLSGGQKIVITGAGFGSAGTADTVAFTSILGGAPIAATTFTVVSDTEIDVTTPDVSSFLGGHGNAGTIVTADVQVTDVSGATSLATPADQIDFPLSIVQLGDSISSGEGTLYGYSYDANTATWQGGNLTAAWSGTYQNCHDSPLAYGPQVAAALNAAFTMLGCTGAGYLNGITAPQVDQNGVTFRPTQFGVYPGGTVNPEYDGANPDVVLVTFGADDAHFDEIVKSCLATDVALSVVNNVGVVAINPTALLQCTPSNPGPTVVHDWFDEKQALSTYYGQLVAGIEARGADATPARIPKIVITDYMNPFPSSTNVPSTCPDTGLMTSTQVQYLSTLLGQLNQLIQTAVTSLNDPNVAFADISHSIDGHTWCTPDPWDYGLSIIFKSHQLSSQAPFHPTPAGQDAIAGIVTPIVKTLVGDTSAAPTATPQGLTVAPDGSLSASGSGFTPNGGVGVTLHSTPVTLGTATADSHGDVTFAGTLPAGTAPGAHELLLTDETTGRAAVLPLTVPPPPTAPAFAEDAPPTQIPIGTTFRFDFAATGDPTPTYTLSGAPAWMGIDPNLGVAVGTPPPGTSSFTFGVTAHNASGADATTGPFTITVTNGGGGITMQPTPVVTVLGGADRLATAIAVSQATFPAAMSAGAVILARDDGFADALAGAPLAAKVDAPVLLSDPAALDAATAAEIQRVLPAGSTVYLLGGAHALDNAVTDSISRLGYQVARYAGADRYATATAIAAALDNPATILLADGTNFADAVSAGPAATSAGGAVLLTDGRSMNPTTAAWLAAHPPTTLYAVGGPAAVAAPAATALAGADRYATAVVVAQRFFSNPAVVGVASGTNYPDALTGGAAAAIRGYPVVLSDPLALSAETASYLHSVAATLRAIDMYGGANALSAPVVAAAPRAG